MALSDELLEVAYQLVRIDREDVQQAALRRALSTAYYAIFHLLIESAMRNWSHQGTRGALGRAFDHGPMRNAALRKVSELNRPANRDAGGIIDAKLLKVADAFCQSQQKRHDADYDTTRKWTPTDVLSDIDQVRESFQCWREIEMEDAAQVFLVSLLRDRARS